MRTSSRDFGDTAVGRRRGERLGGHALDLCETGVPADRTSPGETELDPVVSGRVVRRREHRPCEVELAGREIEQVGRGQPDVDHAETDREQARAESAAELDARLADVACYHDSLFGRLLGEHEPAETDADRVGDAGVELVGDCAPDVVGLENVLEGRFGRWSGHRGHGEASLAGTHRATTMAMMVTVLNAM